MLELIDSMNILKCIDPKCQEKKIFPNMQTLEKHLQDVHRKSLW